ncbi:DUF6783 domain-containing protein [Clostridium sp. MCC353]
MFGTNSVNAARCASLIGTKSSTKCDAQLAEAIYRHIQEYGMRMRGRKNL